MDKRLSGINKSNIPLNISIYSLKSASKEAEIIIDKNTVSIFLNDASSIVGSINLPALMATIEKQIKEITGDYFLIELRFDSNYSGTVKDNFMLKKSKCAAFICALILKIYL